ncbi:MAG: ATP synthase F1 subunit delta [Actinomycetota bacterium]|nr:ATP synthase F1 subunit delta [Actinomycetota bacterium]
MADLTDDRISAYAGAVVAVATAEGQLSEVEDELFRFARLYEQNDELRSTLADTAIPAPRRQQVVEELLGGRASSATTALLSMIVGLNRAPSIPAIVAAALERSAAASDKRVAEVRSAVPLSDEQVTRLEASLAKAIGHAVTVKVVVDPNVMGGIVTQIGDTVIDGSVRSRLGKLREAF